MTSEPPVEPLVRDLLLRVVRGFLQLDLDDVMQGAAKPLMAELRASRQTQHDNSEALCTTLLYLLAPCARIADYAQANLHPDDFYHTPGRSSSRPLPSGHSCQPSPDSAPFQPLGDSLRQLDTSFMSCCSLDTSAHEHADPLERYAAQSLLRPGGPRPEDSPGLHMDTSPVSAHSSYSSIQAVRYRGLLADAFLGTPRAGLPLAASSARPAALRLSPLGEHPASEAGLPLQGWPTLPFSAPTPAHRPPSYNDFVIVKPLSSGAYGLGRKKRLVLFCFSFRLFAHQF